MTFYYLIAFYVAISQLVPKSIFRSRYLSYFLLILMGSLMATVVLLNPITGDMYRYLMVLQQNSVVSWGKALSLVRWEPGFVSYQWILSRFSTSHIVFIVTSMFLMWGLIFSALKKVISIKDLPLVMLGYISLFYFYNFSRNVVRQGFAAPLVLLMIVYLRNGSYRKTVLFLLAALSFHISAIVAGALIVIKKLGLSVKFLLYTYIASSLLMIFGINQRLTAGLVNSVGGQLGNAVMNYSSDNIVSKYGSVNRLDFLIFTTIWVIWGLFFRAYFIKDDSFYEWLLKSYLILSSIYAVFGFIGYSDRLAAYAWFLIPILLSYPVIKMESKYRPIWVVICIFINLILFFNFDVRYLYEPIKLIY